MDGIYTTGKLHLLNGLSLIQYDVAHPASICKSGADVNHFFHLTVKPVNTNPSPKIGASALVVFHNDISSLLHKFGDIFTILKGLPLVRAQDHCIPLLPEVAPVNICPYRYPHFKKLEIKKLMGDMLADGIIRPITSPFSSPVLLIKKKDGT